MMNMKQIRKWIKPTFCGLCLLLTGCGASSLAHGSTFESAYENREEEEPVNIYTSSASVIIESVNEANQTFTVRLIDRKESKTLSYDGATVVQDKYGNPMSMAQLQVGEIADIAYNNGIEKAGSITLSAEAWNYEGVAKYSIDTRSGSASIGSETYSLGGDVLVFSEGKTIEPAQIIRNDVLSFHGRGYHIMSITVDKGHGYLKLKNEEAVLGGWIEIGQATICQIAPNMLLTVPEGEYTVRITAPKVEETYEIKIERNKEVTLDLSDIEIPEPEDGVIIFDITPEKATVLVDDEKVNTTYPLRVSLGLHQITARASGYETLSEYYQIEGETTTIKMDLEEKTEESSTVSDNDLTSSEEEDNKKKEDATITVETPAGAEVYQDDLYMGIAPVTYTKTPGEHTLTFRKTGYITRSYSINVADDTQDETYSFPDLDPDYESENASTVSGNSLGIEGAKITITAPVGAEVYQDNVYMGVVPVTYSKTAGEHTISLRKTGYKTSQYSIKIEDDDKDVNYAFPDLESEKDSSSTVSGNNVQRTPQVTVTEPVGVEVWLDGRYVGIAPVSFAKKPGEHTIELKKDGYISKSYPVIFDDDDKDIVRPFSELIPENQSGDSDQKEENVKVTINAPEGADVYLDDVQLKYESMPITCTTTPGKHKIEVKSVGHVTISQDIYIADDAKEVTYSFPELGSDENEGKGDENDNENFLDGDSEGSNVPIVGGDSPDSDIPENGDSVTGGNDGNKNDSTNAGNTENGGDASEGLEKEKSEDKATVTVDNGTESSKPNTTNTQTLVHSNADNGNDDLKNDSSKTPEQNNASDAKGRNSKNINNT